MTNPLQQFLQSFLGLFSRGSSQPVALSDRLNSLVPRSGSVRDTVRQALLGDVMPYSDTSSSWGSVPSFEFNKTFGNGLLSLSAKYDNTVATPEFSFGASVKPPSTGAIAGLAGEAGKWTQLCQAAKALTPQTRNTNLLAFGLSKTLPAIKTL